MTVELGQPVLPKVLVVLGNYKQSNFIADAIHSIFKARWAITVSMAATAFLSAS
ncbi:hypothetical protein PUV47_05435 [Pseudovibrio exalbescens]|uniref:hypothetical protein n=1 Tax=Pseudovibrio exalbescens TaxID=197461 RepID=UPI002366F923|nr:hypothetical protein [Pseudovibrio exalbescens]MDD7909351.1 hypothetical protein [Pseudovibrio exalbescens]